MTISVYGVVLDSKNAKALAEFYAKLLNEELVVANDDWAAIKTKTGLYIAFQTVEHYKQPVWPLKDDAQHPMAHLDLQVDDLPKAVDHALSCGATKASEQFSDEYMVMLDLDGHPFCLMMSE